MMRSSVAIALGLVAVLTGCPKKNGGGTTGVGTGSGTNAPIKATVISFGTQDLAGLNSETPKTKIWLSVTDETGATKSFPIEEEIAATCTEEPGGELGAVGTLRCWYAGAGANYIAVARQELIVLRQWTQEEDEEPADYEELQRITLSIGAKVTFEP